MKMILYYKDQIKIDHVLAVSLAQRTNKKQLCILFGFFCSFLIIPTLWLDSFLIIHIAVLIMMMIMNIYHKDHVKKEMCCNGYNNTVMGE